MNPMTDKDSEREAFESKIKPMDFCEFDDVAYQYFVPPQSFSQTRAELCERLNEAWRGWQAARAPSAQEPVAWQARLRIGNEWSRWFDILKEKFDSTLGTANPDIELRTLYAAPVLSDVPEGWVLMPKASVTSLSPETLALAAKAIANRVDFSKEPVEDWARNLIESCNPAAPTPPQAQDARDAARYRKFKSIVNPEHFCRYMNYHPDDAALWSRDHIDASLDAALQETQR